MQADDAGTPAPDGPAPPSRFWQRVMSWDREFSIAKGLAIVTVLTSVFGGYFQYLNAYQEKVSTQARDDMTAATATFLEISNALAEMQSQQQLLYSDFMRTFADKTDASDQSLQRQERQGCFRRLRKGADRAQRQYQRAGAQGRDLHRLAERHRSRCGGKTQRQR